MQTRTRHRRKGHGGYKRHNTGPARVYSTHTSEHVGWESRVVTKGTEGREQTTATSLAMGASLQ